MRYKIQGDSITIIGQNIGIPKDPDNRHYREYLEWLAEGNTPEPDDPPPPNDQPTIQERLQAAETLINLILDEEGE